MRHQTKYIGHRRICRRVAVLAIVLAGCTATPTATPPPTVVPSGAGLATFHEQGLVFEYPAAWRDFRYEEFSTMSHLIAYLATVGVMAPCVTSGSRTTCSDRYQLVPDSLVVTIESFGNPAVNILNGPADAAALTVDGLPGYRQVAAPAIDDTTGAQTIVTTIFARPGSVDNWFTITAAMRGPDLGPLEAQVDALIASLRYDPPVVPLPSGSGAATAAAASALAVLSKDSPAWACFVPVGTHQLVIDAVPMGPALVHPQLATCTSAIEATPLQLWRMTLTMRLSEPDANAGMGQKIEVWVNPDGTPGSTRGAPLP